MTRKPLTFTAPKVRATMTVTLPVELAIWLDDYRARVQRGRSDVVREALEMLKGVRGD